MTTPDLTTYRAVHHGLRVGAAALATGARSIDRADDRRRKAYTTYWRGYAGEVLLHHAAEDDTFFPALVERVPVAGPLMVRTDADHHELDELMDEIDTEIALVRLGRPAPRLAELTARLREHMDDHLDMEDQDVLPLFERHFDADEYHQLDEAAVRSLGIGAQALFSVPFVMAAMTPEEARRTRAGAPLPLRVLHRLTRRSHARLVDRAFGNLPVEVA